MKKLMEKTKKTNWSVVIIRAMLICYMAVALFSVPLEVHAADEVSFTDETGGELGQTKLVKGTLALLADVSTVLLIVEAALVGVLCLIQFIAMQQADDSEKPKHKKNIKSIIITGVIACTLTGILAAVFSYYK